MITTMSARRLETVPESSSILFTSDLELGRNREGTELHDFGGPICCKHVTDFLHSSFIGILIKLDRCTLSLFTLTIRFEIMIGIALDSLGYLGISLPIKLLLGVKRELVEIGRNDVISNWFSWLDEQSRGNSAKPSFGNIRYAGIWWVLGSLTLWKRRLTLVNWDFNQR